MRLKEVVQHPAALKSSSPQPWLLGRALNTPHALAATQTRETIKESTAAKALSRSQWIFF